ncbi:hypothetical protein DPMN_068257 [Dreissena polymorpha]|uniref:Uncharacterized protein n=1 Tax=Dreissena polymorpha TaxID=45954 RepID=A0A9D4BWH4_DREPO|nr:hypothetical protein DPMN_068257 [Dreissena polymorpha]
MQDSPSSRTCPSLSNNDLGSVPAHTRENDGHPPRDAATPPHPLPPAQPPPASVLSPTLTIYQQRPHCYQPQTQHYGF